MAIKFNAPSAAAAQDLLAELNPFFEKKTHSTLTPTILITLPPSLEMRAATGVSLQNLSFEYDDAQDSSPALHNISLSITPGSVVAFIGPSGAGKSTLAKRLAGELGFSFFDTGAMYRSVCWYLLDKNIPLEDQEQIEEVLKDFHFQLRRQGDITQFLVNDQDVSQKNTYD